LASHPGRDTCPVPREPCRFLFLRTAVHGVAVRGIAALCTSVLCTAALLALSAGAPARADDAVSSSSVIEAAAAVALHDTLVVSAGAGRAPGAPPGVVTRIELQDEPPGRDLADVLAGAAGFQVRRYGADGSSAVPSLRGATAAQIRFYLDGMPLPDAETGSSGLGLVPVERLQAVEIHRGGAPVQMGGLGGAGAVNLISVRHQPGATGEVRLGSFGERAAQASWGASGRGDWSGLVLAHARRAENDFPFTDHNQTFHRTDDDTVRTRQNAWLEEWGLLAAAAWTAQEWAARASLGVSRRDGGRPGPLGYLSDAASVRHDRADLRLGVGWREDRVRLDLAAGRGEEILHDPLGQVGYDPPGTSRSEARDAGGRLAATLPVAGGLVTFDAGAHWQGQWQRDYWVRLEDPERRRLQHGMFAAATIGDGALRVTPGWRWQRTEDNFPPPPPLPGWPEAQGVRNVRDSESPSLGVVWEIRPGAVVAEAHAARSVREPTWVELFGHRGGIDGNRGLRPERLRAADVALTWRRADGGLSLRAALFFAETLDTIIFRQNSQKTSKAENVGAARTRGLELELTLRPAAGWRLAGNLTWQEARDRSSLPAYDGNELPFLPPVEARVRLGREDGVWRPWCEVEHLAANYRDRANTELDRAPARTRVNVGVARRLGAAVGGDLAIGGQVRNLTDNDVYDVEGYPLPGRSWCVFARLGRE
jgi:outer membrane receptor protein involved in Fe transport